MAYTTWDDLTLCTVADVQAEVRDAALWAHVADASAQRALIQTKIGVAKDVLFERLQSRIPDIYANEQGQYAWGDQTISNFDGYQSALGYTYDELDNWKDRIANPTVLKRVMVALTMAAVFADATGTWRSTEGAPELFNMNISHWRKETELRFDAAVKLLKIDLDNDGTIFDYERVRTQERVMWPR